MKIEIRHAEPDDYAVLAELHAQPRVIWGTCQLPFPSTEEWKKRLTEKADNFRLLVACVDDEIVGALGLHIFKNRRRHVGDLGMCVHDDWQGKGVGTALMEAAVDLADNWFNLSRLELAVYTDNEPGVKLYRKFGFEMEGTFRHYAFRDGEYADAYAMARLK